MTTARENIPVHHHLFCKLLGFLHRPFGDWWCDERGTRREEVDIIIPMYNAYDLSARCIESVLRNSDHCRLILVDDASTDRRIASLLDGVAAIPAKALQVVKLTNQENLGFVRTVNQAYSLTRNNFVILNSDTEVPPGWLDRLFVPLEMDPAIASATPFSNAATICSFPVMGEDNEIYLGLDVEVLDDYFRLHAPSKTIDIPSGVGFCMAFSWRITNEIGLFDDEAFGRGYGEENDFCMRAFKKGYRNVLVPNLFVYHKHGGTFDPEEKKVLMGKNSTTLLARYPEYDELVRRFIEVDPAREIRERILQGLLQLQ